MQLKWGSMAEQDYDVVVLDELTRRYASDESFSKFIDQMASREREPRNHRTVVRRMPSGLSDDECIKILEILAGSGFGEFERGRPKWNSRLVWADDISSLDLAKTIQTAASRGKPAPDGNQPVEVFLFPVSPGETWPLEIPTRFTRGHLENLGEFIKVVARSRE